MISDLLIVEKDEIEQGLTFTGKDHILHILAYADRMVSNADIPLCPSSAKAASTIWKQMDRDARFQ